ncbi:alkaline phosphatase D family protein [Paenibacillus mucilaginosus]|uniref:PhoD n=1 Tax=Paenibacillus mucilaginosus (strain KNP414) TaxID=1036673 RepID=F8F4N3_PAEMK|nr:alkaline phosphatase D family protein [Paenibacillus mucilaginosus]AEI39425.1 PhoD [Paenibacillus mucilaginosus KNP414]WDM28402.1 alkaline phosphatase D family protein [Paenibacillus mucilaginosus]
MEQDKLGLLQQMMEKLGASSMDRRGFLRATGKVAAVSFGLTLASALQSPPKIGAEAFFKSYPFTLGIASGDPLPDGVVLWTRLAPDPLNGGGMPSHDVPVRWEVALDKEFRRIVKHGVEFARTALAHSVHVEVEGLEPNQVYYYRFHAGHVESPVGRTKTLPPYGSAVAGMTFAFASCQNWQDGYYTAYKHMSKENLDLVFHLGDYIYEGGVGTDKVRYHNSPEIVTLEDYRNRYALYKSDADLRAAHEAFPWVVTTDDHEVENNYAGPIPEKDQPVEPFVQRRAAAYQAYYEHMPLRRSSLPYGTEMQLYRRVTYGNLAEFSVLDTRQYRDDQANGDGSKEPNEASMDPNRTLMGAAQERWLLEGLGASAARWNVIPQQVFFAKRDFKQGDAELVSMDAWDGYSANRDRIVNFIKERGVRNVVVLTGDVHANYANEIKADYHDPASPVIGVEFVGTSISSGGDGADTAANTATILAENPHIRFHNTQRGYVRCTLTPDRFQADYLVLPYVSRPDAPIETRVSFEVEDGRPGLKKIYDSALVVTG